MCASHLGVGGREGGREGGKEGRREGEREDSGHYIYMYQCMTITVRPTDAVL